MRGALPSLPRTTLFDLPAAGVVPPGTYVWFIVVDADTNGALNGTFFAYVVTVIGP